MNILVTAGGTKEYIDGVRYIGNSSTGRTGAALVDYLSTQGHHVTWLGAKNAIKPDKKLPQVEYETFEELSSALQMILENNHFDAVFQAAAVSDFKVSSVLLDGKHFDAGRGVKLPTADEVQLLLSKQPKLVSSIKNWSINTEVMVVAFKLTNTQDLSVQRHAVNKLIEQQNIDCVAHNDLNDITESTHGFCLYQKNNVSIQCSDILALADAVLNNIKVAA